MIRRESAVVRRGDDGQRREMKRQELNRQLIEDAIAYLAPLLAPTPVEESPELASILGVPVTLKLEFRQPTGSFKVRGALFRLSLLDREEREHGIVTCSAGNHGYGLAYGARALSVPVRVYVPASVDPVKVDGMRKLGAEVVRSPFPGYDATAEWASEQEKGNERRWISAFDDFAIMAGNGGTLAAEILEQIVDPAAVALPVGGGGLAGGLSYWLELERPAVEVVACQHEHSPALALSLERGEAVTELPAIDTLASGVEGGIGALCFSVLASRIGQVALVSEREIIDAMRWMLETHRWLVEPSAAVAVAACLNRRFRPPDGRLVLILSGQNVSPEVLEEGAPDESR